MLDCGHEASPHTIGTGYGTDERGHTACYACCADRELAAMRKTGRATLYLTGAGLHWEVINWPGSLRFKVWNGEPKIGRHNWAGRRYDAWFSVLTDGAPELWHAVTYGDNTQIAHCRRVKA